MLSPTDQAPEDAETLADVGKGIDNFLSKEMASLSFQERNLMQEEMHGVASMEVEETPELIQSSLKELEAEIENIPDKSAYDKALTIDGGQYVKSQDFQLKFLRAELFNTKKAANRMVAYVRLLSKYYGEKALQRPLRYDDLSREEQAMVRAGFFQVLPQRDRSGRLIHFHYGDLSGEGCTPQNRVRVVLYHWGILAEDVESQKKGVVIIVKLESSVVNNYLNATPRQRKDVMDCWHHHPIRISAQHYCMPEGSPAAVQMMKGLWGFVMSTVDERFRFQAYSAWNTETRYKLMTYGIPSDLPVTSSGNIKTKNHLKWIKMRRAMDDERRSDPSGENIGIAFPNNTDVLFESGGGKWNHYGNTEFAAIMEQKIEEYGFDAKYGVKYYEEVIALVKQRNGRFLEKDTKGRGWWVEITNTEVLHKRLYSALYEHRKRMKSRRRNQQFNMSESANLSVQYQDRKRQRLCQGF